MNQNKLNTETTQPPKSRCEWCTNGMFDEIDYIESLMGKEAKKAAYQLGIKIRNRYWRPECAKCKMNKIGFAKRISSGRSEGSKVGGVAVAVLGSHNNLEGGMSSVESAGSKLDLLDEQKSGFNHARKLDKIENEITKLNANKKDILEKENASVLSSVSSLGKKEVKSQLNDIKSEGGLDASKHKKYFSNRNTFSETSSLSNEDVNRVIKNQAELQAQALNKLNKSINENVHNKAISPSETKFNSQERLKVKSINKSIYENKNYSLANNTLPDLEKKSVNLQDRTNSSAENVGDSTHYRERTCSNEKEKSPNVKTKEIPSTYSNSSNQDNVCFDKLNSSVILRSDMKSSSVTEPENDIFNLVSEEQNELSESKAINDIFNLEESENIKNFTPINTVSLEEKIKDTCQINVYKFDENLQNYQVCAEDLSNYEVKEDKMDKGYIIMRRKKEFTLGGKQDIILLINKASPKETENRQSFDFTTEEVLSYLTSLHDEENNDTFDTESAKGNEEKKPIEYKYMLYNRFKNKSLNVLDEKSFFKNKNCICHSQNLNKEKNDNIYLNEQFSETWIENRFDIDFTKDIDALERKSDISEAKNQIYEILQNQNKISIEKLEKLKNDDLKLSKNMQNLFDILRKQKPIQNLPVYLNKININITSRNIVINGILVHLTQKDEAKICGNEIVKILEHNSEKFSDVILDLLNILSKKQTNTSVKSNGNKLKHERNTNEKWYIPTDNASSSYETLDSNDENYIRRYEKIGKIEKGEMSLNKNKTDQKENDSSQSNTKESSFSYKINSDKKSSKNLNANISENVSTKSNLSYQHAAEHNSQDSVKKLSEQRDLNDSVSKLSLANSLNDINKENISNAYNSDGINKTDVESSNQSDIKQDFNSSIGKAEAEVKVFLNKGGNKIRDSVSAYAANNKEDSLNYLVDNQICSADDFKKKEIDLYNSEKTNENRDNDTVSAKQSNSKVNLTIIKPNENQTSATEPSDYFIYKNKSFNRSEKSSLSNSNISDKKADNASSISINTTSQFKSIISDSGSLLTSEGYNKKESSNLSNSSYLNSRSEYVVPDKSQVYGLYKIVPPIKKTPQVLSPSSILSIEKHPERKKENTKSLFPPSVISNILKKNEKQSLNINKITFEDKKLMNANTEILFDIKLHESSSHNLSATAEQSSDLNTSEKIKNILSEVDKRAVDKPPFTQSFYETQAYTKRYVISRPKRTVNIDDVESINDLRHDTLLMKISKKGKNGNYKSNWFMLKGSHLYCFNSRSHRMTETMLPVETSGDIFNPDDNNSFLTTKYSVDLRNCERFLMGKSGQVNSLAIKPFFKLFKNNKKEFYISLKDKTISNAEVRGEGFVVCLQNKDEEVSTYILGELCVCIESDNKKYYYKFKDLTRFLKWNLAVELRQANVGNDE